MFVKREYIKDWGEVKINYSTRKCLLGRVKINVEKCK
jgi:hypothetical protein